MAFQEEKLYYNETRRAYDRYFTIFPTKSHEFTSNFYPSRFEFFCIYFLATRCVIDDIHSPPTNDWKTNKTNHRFDYDRMKIK